MSRIVIISNRVPVPTPGSRAVGGLAVAVSEAVWDQQSFWFGWSGKTVTQGGTVRVNQTQTGNICYATIDLQAEDFAGYYDGFANAMLWPLLHGLPSISVYDRAQWESYERVNNIFAQALRPLLRPTDLIWVHDYHLFTLGRALRALGVVQPIGFFLHIPFPSPDTLEMLPKWKGLIRSLGAYDLIGTQSSRDEIHLNAAMASVGLQRRARKFPIGIDPYAFAEAARRADRGPRLRDLEASLKGRPLIVGVDRLDYTKGIPHRFKGFAKLLHRFPAHRAQRATMLQIAPVSRDHVASYRALRLELDQLVGRINGEYGDVDWTPLRYVTRAIARPTVAGYYRMACVGLVTPLRDGMNLVAKEYVAAQDPGDPGVLVLSRFAGAADELADAVQINPNDPDAIAEALDQALTMPLDERRARWERMMASLRANTGKHWARNFIAALRDSTAGQSAPLQEIAV